MNAYELAKKLEWYTNYDEFVEAGAMLRQQADRIAELEKELYFKNYYEELPDTPVGIIGKIGDSPIHDLVHRTTPQIKELSDEEILSLSAFKNSSYDVFIEYEKEDLIKFARAILKKASEK
jgi:hypothetical protein